MLARADQFQACGVRGSDLLLHKVQSRSEVVCRALLAQLTPTLHWWLLPRKLDAQRISQAPPSISAGARLLYDIVDLDPARLSCELLSLY